MKTGTLTKDPLESTVETPLKQHRTEIAMKERCDKCGAQAFVAVEMKSAGELLFCGHHYNAYKAKLDEVAEFVLDNRDKINAKPTSGAHQD